MLKLISLLLFLSLIISCNNQIDNGNGLKIAAAANMQFALEELTTQFTQKTQIETELIISSSGKLTAQIKEGAPFDVFLSADMKYPMDLYKSGLTQSKPLVYGYGQLVLWTMNETLLPSLDSLPSNTIKHIALANPKTAPYGLATKEVLENNELWDVLKDKLVFGESIAQTNQFIMTQAADIGFTAKSVVLSSTLKNKGKWLDIDPKLYSPIAQGFVIINHSKTDFSKAEAFQKFLFSKEAQKILKEVGYLSYEQP